MQMKKMKPCRVDRQGSRANAQEQLSGPPGSRRGAARRLDRSRPPGPAEDETRCSPFLEGLVPGSRMFRFFSAGTDLEAAARLMARRRLRAALRIGRDPRRERPPGRSGHLLRSRARTGRGRVRDRRGPAGTRARDDPARPPGRGRPGQRHLDVRGGGAAGEPPDDRGVSRERLPGRVVVGPGSIHVELPTSFSAEAVERFEQRDRLAAAAACAPFLEPRAVAVIGASRRARHRRRRALPQHARRRLRRRRLPGQSRAPRSSSRCAPTRASARSRTTSTSP